ncbi:hypothetical protein [Peribacillus frigoritolerans]|uniref:hypothetical protein n=1 Tax=Peribacillus frigoritolerans TaxID=450367 RepID=UPI002040A488|nr:hypothetical protein [Peribacillus frigoritolerans]MCM3170177.1 hypothetical protein [Peribacillus frigoritolerans]
MNENKVLLIGLIGFSLFLMGMVISQWTVAGVVIGIGGGLVMGISSYLFASQ